MQLFRLVARIAIAEPTMVGPHTCNLLIDHSSKEHYIGAERNTSTESGMLQQLVSELNVIPQLSQGCCSN
jgi:hypothetical protein